MMDSNQPTPNIPVQLFQQPFTPPPPKPNHKLIFVLGGIVILAIFISGGLFLGKYLYTPKSPVTIQPTITPAQTITPSLTPTDLNREPDGSAATANWKIYSNNELSFKYPSNWIAENNRIVGSNPNIVIYVVPKDLTLMNECMKLDVTKSKTGFVVKKFSRVATGEMCATNDSSPREMWIVPSGSDYAPGFSYSYTTNGNPEAESIFDQILSTFRFLQ